MKPLREGKLEQLPFHHGGAQTCGRLASFGKGVCAPSHHAMIVDGGYSLATTEPNNGVPPKGVRDTKGGVHVNLEGLTPFRRC